MKLNKVTAVCALSFAFSAVNHAQQVSGKITNLAGQPIVNAKVAIENSPKFTFTDESGQFIFNDLSEGKIELHVTAQRFSHKNIDVEIQQDDVSNISVQLAPSVMEVIDVHATPLHTSTIESALPVNVIAADELKQKHASTLGETLKNEVGVHSNYYGPTSSSPIIRGLDGPRVMITQNGLDVGDASRVGPDHVVSSETSTAEQVEVLRGPATLFYGSGAIGGVVNVVDKRVPTEIDNQIDFMVQHNDVADENEASIAINTGEGNVAFHFDGFMRESNDYKIPGVAELADDHHDHDGHEELDAHDDHEEHEEHGDENSGKLANSASKSSGFTVGTSYLLDNGFVGVSFGRMEREYGIPGHVHGHHEDEHEEEHGDHEDEHEEHGEEAESVKGDLVQNRYQLLSELNFEDSFINKLASKIAYTDYQHQEIENGEVGTQFSNDMLEARFDLHHQAYNGWKGAWTFHYKNSDFEAVGEEAFTPPSETESVAVAWLEEKHFDDVLLQLGLRAEHVTINAHQHEEHDDDHGEHDEHEEIEFSDQSFTPISASAGIVWDYQQGYNIGFSTSFSQRAPSSSELFSNGPHIGTNTYEVGALYEVEAHGDHAHIEYMDKDIDLETSYNVDLTWRKFDGDFGFVVSAFYNHIKDYFYQQDTGFFMEDGHAHGGDHEDDHGEAEEGLPIFAYQQDDVDMYGVEAQFIYQINDEWQTTVFGDYINAQLTDGGYLPRIPPMRLGGQLNYQTNNYGAELSVMHYFEQDNIAETETVTDAYTIVDAHFNYYLEGIGNDLVFFVKGQNLTDEEARVHSSFLKNVAPLPGRGFSVGIRGSF